MQQFDVTKNDMRVDLIKAKEYAKTKGVNQDTITRWKKEGKLVEYYVPNKKRPFFNPEE